MVWVSLARSDGKTELENETGLVQVCRAGGRETEAKGTTARYGVWKPCGVEATVQTEMKERVPSGVSELMFS